MRYETAARVDPASDGPDAGRWRYVSMNPGVGGHPIGYCAQGCPGHETREGAYEHQTEYVLDHLREWAMSDQQLRCEVDGCDEWAQGGLRAPDGYHAWVLCDEHRHREAVAELLGTVGDSWVS